MGSSKEEVLAMKPEDLPRLSFLNWEDRKIEAEEIAHIFSLCDAFWMHSGDPAQPHAQLTSGLCSNGFVDCNRAFSWPNICDILATEACMQLAAAGGFIRSSFDWVIGSAYAGITFSFAVAGQLGTRHGFAEKGEGKEQVWQRLIIQPGKVVLQCEELMTTALTTQAVRVGLEKGNPHPVTFAPVVLVGIHRSDVYEVDGRQVIYVAHYDIWTSKPEDCPLCAAGSKRLRPKTNWAELTGKA